MIVLLVGPHEPSEPDQHEGASRRHRPRSVQLTVGVPGQEVLDSKTHRGYVSIRDRRPNPDVAHVFCAPGKRWTCDR